jgi:Rrf2 family protein
MKLSTRMRYGTRALVELAADHPRRVVSVRELAGRVHVSAKYLEQIMAVAKSAGIVVSAVGARGGYRLARPPHAIRLCEIQMALEDPDIVACISDPASCYMSDTCPTRDTWIAVKDAIGDVLGGVTLQDLLERSRRKARLRKELS